MVDKANELKTDLVESLKSIMEDPAGTLMLKENCSIPTQDGAELLGEELEFLRSDKGQMLLLERITRRLSLDKLIRSHSLVTNMLLRLAIELDIRLNQTSFSLDGDKPSFVSRSLEISPDGNYTDSELTDIASMCLAEINRRREISSNAYEQVKNVKDESARITENKNREIQSLKKELEVVKKYQTPSLFFFTATDQSGNRFYLTCKEEVYTQTSSFEEAAIFNSEDEAIDALSFALAESRNFKNDPAFSIKVWDFKVCETVFKPIELKTGGMSILKAERAKESAKAFEEHTAAVTRDYSKVSQALEELQSEGLVDSSILIDGDLGIEIPDIKKPKPKSLPRVKQVKNAGKTAVKSKSQKALLAQRLRQSRAKRS